LTHFNDISLFWVIKEGDIKEIFWGSKIGLNYIGVNYIGVNNQVPFDCSEIVSSLFLWSVLGNLKILL